jgi:hypothetical protein
VWHVEFATRVGDADDLLDDLEPAEVERAIDRWTEERSDAPGLR